MGSYINVGMVSNDKMNVFINKCKEIIEKYCNISSIIIKFPIDNDCENWVEYVKNAGDVREVLGKCCDNEFAQCRLNFSTVGKFKDSEIKMVDIKFNLHDSMIENIDYIHNKKELKLKIYLCNWKQKNYQDGDPEMIELYLIFHDVKSFETESSKDIYVNGEIIEVKQIDGNTLKFMVLCDNDTKNITISAREVSYFYD